MAIGILSFDQKVPTFLKKLGRFQQKTGRFRQRIAEFLFANAEGGGAQVLTPVIDIVRVDDFPFAFIIGSFDSAVYLVLVDVDAQAVEAQGDGRIDDGFEACLALARIPTIAQWGDFGDGHRIVAADGHDISGSDVEMGFSHKVGAHGFFATSCQQVLIVLAEGELAHLGENGAITGAARADSPLIRPTRLEPGKGELLSCDFCLCPFIDIELGLGAALDDIACRAENFRPREVDLGKARLGFQTSWGIAPVVEGEPTDFAIAAVLKHPDFVHPLTCQSTHLPSISAIG